jgi:hypothetical protein
MSACARSGGARLRPGGARRRPLLLGRASPVPALSSPRRTSLVPAPSSPCRTSSVPAPRSASPEFVAPPHARRRPPPPDVLGLAGVRDAVSRPAALAPSRAHIGGAPPLAQPLPLGMRRGGASAGRQGWPEGEERWPATTALQEGEGVLFSFFLFLFFNWHDKWALYPRQQVYFSFAISALHVGLPYQFQCQFVISVNCNIRKNVMVSYDSNVKL